LSRTLAVRLLLICRPAYGFDCISMSRKSAKAWKIVLVPALSKRCILRPLRLTFSWFRAPPQNVGKCY